MAQHHFEGDTKKFTLTAFLSFALVFCLLVLFSNCHGDFKPGGAAHHAAGGHDTEQHHNNSGNSSHTATPQDTTHTHGVDSSSHGTSDNHEHH